MLGLAWDASRCIVRSEAAPTPGHSGMPGFTLTAFFRARSTIAGGTPICCAIGGVYGHSVSEFQSWRLASGRSIRGIEAN